MELVRTLDIQAGGTYNCQEKRSRSQGHGIEHLLMLNADRVRATKQSGSDRMC